MQEEQKQNTEIEEMTNIDSTDKEILRLCKLVLEYSRFINYGHYWILRRYNAFKEDKTFKTLFDLEDDLSEYDITFQEIAEKNIWNIEKAKAFNYIHNVISDILGELKTWLGEDIEEYREYRAKRLNGQVVCYPDGTEKIIEEKGE